MKDTDEEVLGNSSNKKTLDKKLESIGWGVFLIMIGGLWLVPPEKVPEGTWLIGVGLIMIGLNLVRYLKGIKLSGFTIVVGCIALIAGFSGFYGIDLPLFAILLILFGASLLLKPLFEKRGNKQT